MSTSEPKPKEMARSLFATKGESRGSLPRSGLRT